MSIDVTFYTFSKRENSTARPAGGTTHQCNLRDGSDKFNPNIEYRGTGVDINSSNYMYIPLFGRYYYIDRCEYNAEQNFWLVSGSVDVLATFRGSIHASGVKVARAYSDYDVTLADSLDLPQGEPIKLANFIGSDFIPPLTNAFNNSAVICNIAGRGWVCMTGQAYQAMMYNFFAQNDPFNISEYFTQDIAKNIVNPASYIISAHCIPISSLAMAGSTPFTLKMGWYEVSGVTCYALDHTTLEYTTTIAVPSHPQAEGLTDYLNYAPFAHHKLFLQGLGMIEIDSSNCNPTFNLTVNCRIDCCTGGVVVIVRNNNGLPVGYATGEIGYSLSVYSRKSPDIIGMASNVLLGGALGGAGGAIGGAMHGITSLGGAGSVAVHGSTGGAGAWAGNNQSCLISTFRRVKRPDTLTQGRPLYANRILGELSGYVQVMQGCGDVICTGSDTEKAKIKSYLEGGVYIE